jgi:hypothetical protein
MCLSSGVRRFVFARSVAAAGESEVEGEEGSQKVGIFVGGRKSVSRIGGEGGEEEGEIEGVRVVDGTKRAGSLGRDRDDDDDDDDDNDDNETVV